MDPLRLFLPFLFVLICIQFNDATYEATLACYVCGGNDAACPREPTEKDLRNMYKETCPATSAQCVRFNYDLPNGDRYTYRACEPENVGIKGTHLVTFCDFISKVYEPFSRDAILLELYCNPCSSSYCNT